MCYIYYMSHFSIIINDNNGCKKCEDNENEQDKDCVRKDFINNCMPFFDVENSKINILNNDGKSYIYYYGDNVDDYILNTNFTLQKHDKIKNYFIKDKTCLLDKLNYNIIDIPIYYLFIDSYYIFNIFLNYFFYYEDKDFKVKDRKDFIDKIFTYTNEKYKFMGFSYKFNIFNIALTCNKYFKIIPLFLNKNNNIENIESEISKIFNNYDIEKMYNLIHKYKYQIQNNKKKEGFDNFISEIFKKNDKEFSNIVNIENNLPKKTKEILITELANMIFYIKKVLIQINEKIPNFDKIFLMSILSFRLKENLINNTWPFDKNNIYDYIVDESIKNDDLNEDNINDIKNMFDTNALTIYDYSKINYNNEVIGNCMENVLLQFLKILFYDKKLSKFNIKNDMFKNNIYDNISETFNNINKEKTKDFNIDWFNFIITIKEGDFKNKEKQYELNPTFDNFIIFLKYIFKEELYEEKSDYEFLNNIITNINNKYNIEIDISNIIDNIETDVIKINCYDTYLIYLKHNTHANIEYIKKLDENNNILNNITNYNDLNIYLQNNQSITLSDIPAYISLYTLSTTDVFFINKLKNILNIDTIINKYKLLCENNIKDILEKNDFSLFNNFNISIIKEYWDENIWTYNILNNKNNDFWNKIINKTDIIENWSDYNLLGCIIDYNIFNKIVDNKLNIFNKKELLEYLINTENKHFLIKLIENKLYEKWDLDWWIYLINKNTYFYQFICENKLYRNWIISFWDGLLKDNSLNNVNSYIKNKPNSYQSNLIDELIKDNNKEWNNDTWKAAIKYITVDKWFMDNKSTIENNNDVFEWCKDNYFNEKLNTFNNKSIKSYTIKSKIKKNIEKKNIGGYYYKINKYLKYYYLI